MSIHLTKNIFEENLNTKFWLFDERRASQSMDLIELTNGHTSARQEQFSLLSELLIF